MAFHLRTLKRSSRHLLRVGLSVVLGAVVSSACSASSDEPASNDGQPGGAVPVGTIGEAGTPQSFEPRLELTLTPVSGGAPRVLDSHAEVTTGRWDPMVFQNISKDGGRPL